MGRDQLIRHLRDEVGVLRSPRIEGAFREIDRVLFVPQELQDEAYEDYPLPLGHGATISQPTTVAFMLEKLEVRECQKVLDIGSGSGWTTALLAHLVGSRGTVIGLEIVPELVALGRGNVRRWYSNVPQNIGIPMPEIRQAEKGVFGLPREAPFDRILVSAAAREAPKELISQLAPDGILVIPVGSRPALPLAAFASGSFPQSIFKIRKKPDGSLETEEYPGFVFVPLR